MKQKIIVTALPNGVSERSGTWKIAVAISLQVEDAHTTLQQVPDMLQWAQLVKNARYAVQINGTTVEAKLVSKPADAELWNKLFTPTVKVRPFVQEDLSNIPIASYPVKHVLGHIKGIVEKAGKDFHTDMPDGSFYTENPDMAPLTDYALPAFSPKRRESRPLSSMVTDKQTGKRLKGVLNKNKFIPFRDTPEPAMDFAQLKNFHGLYDVKEVKNFVQVPIPDFEFHDILSVLSNYPQLQKKLGLVAELEFAGPDGSIPVIKAVQTVRVILSNINFTVPTTLVCPATRAQKAALQKFSPQQVRSKELAGEPIIAMLTEAPGNKAPIGGLKVTTANGWFAARPSGTEDVYKLYAESFKGQAHLLQIQEDAQALIKQVFSSAGA